MKKPEFEAILESKEEEKKSGKFSFIGGGQQGSIYNFNFLFGSNCTCYNKCSKMVWFQKKILYLFGALPLILIFVGLGKNKTFSNT